MTKVIPVAGPIIDEEEKQAVLDVLNSGVLAEGPRVREFEEAFARLCGVQFAIATSSGTAALHIALLAHGIGPGDEVITSPFTFIASANSILYTGAKPVFVEIDPDTFNVHPELIESAITPNTRAILPVHLFGLSCDMRAIMEIAERHRLVVIEDACQSHGARYENQPVGSFGTGVFSFYATKNITSGEGGMITTNDSDFMEKCRAIRQHGMRKRYYHDELGFNFRMTDVHAAIGLAQLNKLSRFNQARRSNARYLDEHLQGVKVPYIPPNCDHVYHQYTIRVASRYRDRLKVYLYEHGIGSEVYYPLPVHLQGLYAGKLGYRVNLPEAELAAREVLSLPVHPRLVQADLEEIVAAVNQFMQRSSDVEGGFQI